MPSPSLALIGSVFVALGIPLAMGRVPPNGIYGFRTPATLSDSSLWYRVNRSAVSVAAVVVIHGLLTIRSRQSRAA